MIAMMLLGAGLGAVMWLLIVTIRPPQISPVAALAQIDALYNQSAHGPTHTLSGEAHGPSRVGRRLADWAEARGLAFRSLRRDVALAGTSIEALLVVKLVGALAGFLVALLAVGVFAAIGLVAPLPVALIGAALVAAAAFVIPDAVIAGQANRRRDEFRHALSAYVEWVQLEMAGSAAPAEALAAAARAGFGWPFALIRATLFRAVRSGTGQWAALADLGDQIGVKELADLGRLVRSVAADGAQVRSTLTSRAAGMRHAALADQAGEEGKKDQSMQIAQILVGLGFLLFIGYPAVVQILAI